MVPIWFILHSNFFIGKVVCCLVGFVVFLGGFLKKTAVSWVGSNFINPGRDRQLISFEVHFEKAAFSEEIDRFSWRY